ncbi:protein FATTY ACID EXPORT 2, chloroplastic [Phalaenopsis equestris]|uniref:protein FATTY ACID EXPORT 2, chloroplastic n=1 Tax=Phalaenopsis equestris TaxID=78828 RepID=UPI0009E5CC04|nr:protein FATTY ACID EXPORT 2, chloroplastic [Phalaenopsis equestris]
MAAVVIPSNSAPSLLRLSRISSSSSPSRFPFPSIRYSNSHLFSTVTCRRSAAPSFPGLARSRGRCIIAFVDLDEAPYALTEDPPFDDVDVVEEIKVVRDLGGGVAGGGEGDGFGGGDDGGGDDGGGGEGGKSEGEGESGKGKKVSGMSMSQKLTLGYAALVGVGGVMGYMKSGSQKSLAAGGGSALLLYYVYTQLPVRPAFASSLGLGLSAALLAVMGSRFKRSGKIFPAGVVSIISFIMAGGYFHGILRSLHA